VSENDHRILSAPLAARQADTDNLIRFAVGIFYRSPRIILAPVLIHPTSVARSSAAWRAPSVGIGDKRAWRRYSRSRLSELFRRGPGEFEPDARAVAFDPFGHVTPLFEVPFQRKVKEGRRRAVSSSVVVPPPWTMATSQAARCS